MHTNPFTSTGYDLSDLQRKIDQKADSHEVHSLRSTVDRLESSMRELRSENDGLRNRCERLEESHREIMQRFMDATIFEDVADGR